MTLRTSTRRIAPEEGGAGGSPGQGRPQWWRLTPLVLAAAVLVWIAVEGWQGPRRDATLGTVAASGGQLYKTLIQEIVLNPWFYGVFGLVLLLEWLIPADAEQKTLKTRGFRQDLLWTALRLPSFALIMPLYAVVLHQVYDDYLSFLTIQSIAEWPWLLKVVFAILFGDLVFWISHFLRHKVRYLWHFHAVHHSQRELNFFTEYRTHPVDDLMVYTIHFIPMFMVETGNVTVIAVVWLRHWHTRLYHANIRTNFGWLRYLLVTPQSHRVHHSSAPEHADTNFGLTFSIWDHLFGTQYRGYDEYPETGIDDEDFPAEQDELGPGTIFAQLVYPFRAIAYDRSSDTG